jgi:hypothetical protein
LPVPLTTVTGAGFQNQASLNFIDPTPAPVRMSHHLTAEDQALQGVAEGADPRLLNVKKWKKKKKI